MDSESAQPSPDANASRALFDAAEALSRSEVVGSDQRLARAALHELGIAAAEARQQPATPSENQLAALRARHAQLLSGLEGARLFNERRERRRWAWFTAATLVGALLAFGLFRAVNWIRAPRNLLEGKPWVASSEGLKCRPEHHECGGTRTDIFFHTTLEASPWIRYDFGAPTSFRSVTVRNRQDMGLGRCTPLVLEVGDDGNTWREVTRTREAFSTWAPTFPEVKARFLRLRVDGRTTWLHLEAVGAHP